MPPKPARPCTYPGCGKLSLDGSSRCLAHKASMGAFADKARGNRHERGYGAAWDKRRVAILMRDCGLCQQCKRDGVVMTGNHVDHIKPRSEGGMDDADNLQVLCGSCHRIKTADESRRGRGRGGKFL